MPKGKTPENIRRSRKLSRDLAVKFDAPVMEVLSSVWYAACRAAKVDGVYRYGIGRTMQMVRDEPKKWKNRPETLRLYRDTSFALVGQSRGGESLSFFPYNIARRVVAFYTEEGATVLDPCAGHNSRMQAVFEASRHYIGYDVCHRFMIFNRKVRKKLLVRAERAFVKNRATITLHEQTSERMEEEDESIDLVFTSPPYWDIEKYDDHPDQLGVGKTYQQFLKGLSRVFGEAYRVLKPGQFFVLNVNDFRKGGHLYTYHSDVLPYLYHVGFILHDLIIMVWDRNPLRACFPSVIMREKQVGRRHEYLIVLRKPGGKKVKRKGKRK